MSLFFKSVYTRSVFLDSLIIIPLSWSYLDDYGWINPIEWNNYTLGYKPIKWENTKRFSWSKANFKWTENDYRFLL